MPSPTHRGVTGQGVADADENEGEDLSRTHANECEQDHGCVGGYHASLRAGVP